MADHLHDDEQVEALKRWWDENGKSTIAAVVLAIGGTVGWQQYQVWEADKAEAAAEVWDQVQGQLDAEGGGDTESITALANTLKEAHGSTVYAQFAALRLAAIAVEAEDLDGAEQELRWALAQGEATSELGQLIQLRLARVLAAKGEHDAAIRILETGSSGYAAAYASALGDVHLSLGDDQKALTAYLEARDLLMAMGSPAGILDVKITSLESRLADTGASS